MNTVVLRQAVQALHDKYGPDITEVAALVFTTRRLMKAASEQHGCNPAGLLKTLDKVVESHLIDRELHPHMLRRAINELEQDVTSVPH